MWEYWVEVFSCSVVNQMDFLSKMGKKGWELVAVAPRMVGSDEMIAYLKRPLQGTGR
jgi:hypothetical protein